MTHDLTLKATFMDIAPPVVTITAPKPNERVSNTVFTVTGAARDNVGVAGSLLSIERCGHAARLNGYDYTNWFTPTLPWLSATQNLLQVYAVDASGNISATSGTHTYKTYSPEGALLQLKYTSPKALAGATNYLQLNFSAAGSGSIITTFYENAGGPPATGGGNFSIQPTPGNSVQPRLDGVNAD